MFKSGSKQFFSILKMLFILPLVSETTYRKYDGPCENRQCELPSCTNPFILLVSILTNNV